MTSNKVLLQELARETGRFFRAQKKEQELVAFVRDKVPSEIEEEVRQMYTHVAELLRKQCNLTVPEIRRYLDEMRTLTI